MPTKDEEAATLARKHYDIDLGLIQVFRVLATPELEALSSEPIKLLEVNDLTSASGILPIGFGPAPGIGIHHPTIIIEVTPEEFDQILTQELALPNGWQIGKLIPRETAAPCP
ncbi:hypothetical protein [Aquisphaera insulae]|uniref:hypothetical protein n=1 Tax=Aquisphaera insulae TaxID=2712864 RepID=UPI0013EA5314|nr:hypothetical protein [Aquisphaera insulae]